MKTIFLLLPLLAQSAPVQPVSHEFLGQLVAGLCVLGVLAGVLGWQVGKRKVTIDPQPLSVKLEEQFVTRREFERLEAHISRDVAEIKGLFGQTMQAIQAQNTSLSKKIENQGSRLSDQVKEVAQNAYVARGKIHANVNAQGAAIAALQATHDVAGQIGKLADAIQLKNP